MKRPHSDDDEDDDESGPSKRPAIETFSLDYPPLVLQSTPPAIQRPSPLLTFSYTPSRELEFTDSTLRYFVDPPPNADLNEGYERWIRKRESIGRIDGLLKAWDRFVQTNGVAQVGVIAWRGVMTKCVLLCFYILDDLKTDLD